MKHFQDLQNAIQTQDLSKVSRYLELYPVPHSMLDALMTPAIYSQNSDLVELIIGSYSRRHVDGRNPRGRGPSSFQ